MSPEQAAIREFNTETMKMIDKMVASPTSGKYDKIYYLAIRKLRMVFFGILKKHKVDYDK